MFNRLHFLYFEPYDFRNPIALRLAMASVFDYIPKRQCGPGYIRFGRRCLKIPVPR